MLHATLTILLPRRGSISFGLENDEHIHSLSKAWPNKNLKLVEVSNNPQKIRG